MTARFRSAFAGFSGYVAAIPSVRVTPAKRPSAAPADKPAARAGAEAQRPTRAG